MVVVCSLIFPVPFATHRRMIECLVRVAETVHFTLYHCLIPTPVRTYAGNTRHVVWLPWVQHVHLVLTIAHFTQIDNPIIVLIAIYMIYLLFWPAPFADRPNGMVQIDKDLLLVYPAIYA